MRKLSTRIMIVTKSIPAEKLEALMAGYNESITRSLARCIEWSYDRMQAAKLVRDGDDI